GLTIISAIRRAFCCRRGPNMLLLAPRYCLLYYIDWHVPTAAPPAVLCGRWHVLPVSHRKRGRRSGRRHDKGAPRHAQLRAELLIICLNLCAHLLPAKLLRAHWTSLREPPARSLVAQQVHDGPGELLVPLWWRQKTIHPIANHAAKAWNVRGHHGGSAGKRLQQHDALTLTTGVGRAK